MKSLAWHDYTGLLEWSGLLDCGCAGTYTPVCLLALHGALGNKLLILVWTGAGLGILQSLFWVSLPKLVTACLYLALGWLAAHYKDVSFTVAAGPLLLPQRAPQI